jgi:hypothetical protein
MTQILPNPDLGTPVGQVGPSPYNGLPPNITVLQAMAIGVLPAQTEIFLSNANPTTLAQALSSGAVSASASAALLQFAPTYTVTAISQASSGVVTINQVSSTNPFTVGYNLNFENISGMIALNNVNATITAVGGSSGAWTATFNINTSAMPAFVATSNAVVEVGYATYGGN